MRFRLFRSRAFWFGVPGLGFLVWAWWLSMGHFSAAGSTGIRPGGIWGIGQVGGEVFAAWNSDLGPEWASFSAGHRERTGEEARQEKDSLMALGEEYPSFRVVFIPYHWPVLGYVAGWAGLVFWRSRKYRAEVEAG